MTTFFTVILVSLVGFNLFRLVSTPAEVLNAKLLASSISKGDSYIGKLRLWKIYVLYNDWDKANELQSHLDPADTRYYLEQYSPESIKQKINTLQFKSNKSTEDWIELAKHYYRFNDTKSARDALIQAQKLDPIRDDISNLLRSLN